jgi:vitamin B12 transporter
LLKVKLTFYTVKCYCKAFYNITQHQSIKILIIAIPTFMKHLFLFSTLLFATFYGFSQEALDSILVSATRLPVKKQEAGKNITIITSAEIQRLPINSVDELLLYVGGININSRSGFGVQADIGMRGSTFSQVLILVDKQRINDPLTAHFNSNIPIPLAEIERIVIVYGSAAVSYGSDAVGGIIHIITKAYANMEKPSNASFNGQLGIGQNNLTLTDVGFYQQGKKFGISTAIKTSTSPGEQLINPNYTNAGLGDSLFRNHFDLKTYTTALTFRSDKWKVYTRFGGDFRDFSAKYFYTSSPYDESKEWVNAYWTQGAITRNTANGKTELNFSYRNNTDSFVFNPLFAPNFHTTNRINATLTHAMAVGKTRVAFGTQTDYQIIESTDRGNHKYNSQAAFLQATKKLGLLNINGGLRLEYSPTINLQLIPQVNLSYFLNGYVVRSSIGKSIRQADFTERYVSHLIPNLSAGRNAGNPDLQAELAYTFDIGIDAHKSKKVKWSNTFFIRQSQNLIDYVNTNSNDIINLTNLIPSTNYLYATNISNSLTFGNEFFAKFTLLEKGKSRINSQLNYTFIKTKTPDGTVSKYIANHPVHNINGSISYTFSSFNLLVGGAFITRKKENIEAINGFIPSSYSILNTKLSYSLAAVPCKVFIDVRNIANTQYQEILGAKMPSRWILGGIYWSL